MSTPITPQMAIDMVQLQRMNILLNPVWNGTAWTYDLNEIKIEGIGNSGSGENLVAGASIVLTAADLPVAGQTALQQLAQFVEQAIADQYP